VLSLTYTRRALRDLAALPAADGARMRERLKAHAAAPEASGQDVTPLRGTPGSFRLRSGDWRALFTVGGGAMTVYRIGHRQEVYR
jgi:mRNA-degrading endonuclease RelE of RelBE toxin-antitoxin system